MIEVDNPPPDPKERTLADPAPLYPSDPATGTVPVDLRPAPEPCVICGAPLGSCTGHDDPAPAEMGPAEGDGAVIPRKPDPRRVRVQGTEDTNSDPGANVFVCPDDVVEVFESGLPGKSIRKSRRLVHRKGEIITRDRAIELGLVDGVPSTPAVPPPPRRSVEGTPVTVPQL